MLAGYEIISDIKSLDISTIDCSDIKEKIFNNQDLIQLRKILGNISNNNLTLLDIENTFIIELNGNKFYVLNDFGDGNYLSINEKGSVFGMIHDPYEIEKLFKTKEDFFDALEAGDFNIDKYYASKF